MPGPDADGVHFGALPVDAAVGRGPVSRVRDAGRGREPPVEAQRRLQDHVRPPAAHRRQEDGVLPRRGGLLHADA